MYGIGGNPAALAGTPVACAAADKPVMNLLPRDQILVSELPSRRLSIVAMDAAIPSRDRKNNEDMDMFSMHCIMCFGPVTHEMQYPFAIALLKVARSACTPKNSWAPPSASLKPVLISSKINSAPFFRVSEAISAKYDALGTSTSKGIIITAAIS